MVSVECFRNQLTVLNVSGCNSLKFIECSRNQLSTAALISLFGMLPDNSTVEEESKMYIGDNPGLSNDGEFVNARSIAIDKGWYIFD